MKRCGRNVCQFRLFTAVQTLALKHTRERGRYELLPGSIARPALARYFPQCCLRQTKAAHPLYRNGHSGAAQAYHYRALGHINRAIQTVFTTFAQLRHAIPISYGLFAMPSIAALASVYLLVSTKPIENFIGVVRNLSLLRRPKPSTVISGRLT